MKPLGSCFYFWGWIFCIIKWLMCEYAYDPRSISRVYQADSYVKHFSQPITWITPHKMARKDPSPASQSSGWVKRIRDEPIYAGTRSSLLFHAYHFISIHSGPSPTPPEFCLRVRFRVCGKQEYNKFIVASQGLDQDQDHSHAPRIFYVYLLEKYPRCAFIFHGVQLRVFRAAHYPALIRLCRHVAHSSFYAHMSFGCATPFPSICHRCSPFYAPLPPPHTPTVVSPWQSCRVVAACFVCRICLFFPSAICPRSRSHQRRHQFSFPFFSARPMRACVLFAKLFSFLVW